MSYRSSFVYDSSDPLRRYLNSTESPVPVLWQIGQEPFEGESLRVNLPIFFRPHQFGDRKPFQFGVHNYVPFPFGWDFRRWLMISWLLPFSALPIQNWSHQSFAVHPSENSHHGPWGVEMSHCPDALGTKRWWRWGWATHQHHQDSGQWVGSSDVNHQVLSNRIDWTLNHPEIMTKSSVFGFVDG